MTTSLPRHLIWEVSDCQTGAVAVLIPFPMPAMTRPTIICATLYAEICRMAPTVIILVPTRTVFLRPSFSPSQTAMTAPKKQPMSYIAVTVLMVLVASGPLRPNVSKKSCVTITPPNTP